MIHTKKIKIIILLVTSILIVGCAEKPERYPVHFHFQNKPIQSLSSQRNFSTKPIAIPKASISEKNNENLPKGNNKINVPIQQTPIDQTSSEKNDIQITEDINSLEEDLEGTLKKVEEIENSLEQLQSLSKELEDIFILEKELEDLEELSKQLDGKNDE